MGLKVPPPPLDVKLTVPVGVIGVPVVSSSVTVAVHVVEAPTFTLPGVQLTLVLVERLVGASLNFVCACEPAPLAVR